MRTMEKFSWTKTTETGEKKKKKKEKDQFAKNFKNIVTLFTDMNHNDVLIYLSIISTAAFKNWTLKLFMEEGSRNSDHW
uniref:Uncharacterized protein n=1 Tax=Onchocerca volvulus TaxID=6282 RepID=A0A8R1TVG4_ONCVO